MKTVSLKMLLDHIKDDAQGNRGCGFMLLGFFAFILVMSGAVLSPFLIVPFLFFAVPGFFLLRSSKKKKQAMEEHKFYITTSHCRKKESRIGGDEADAYILFFENGIEYTISSDDVKLNQPEHGHDDQWVYDQTQEGDAFYLIVLEGDKGPSYVLSQRLCQLDMTGFEEENGCIRPRRSNGAKLQS